MGLFQKIFGREKITSKIPKDNPVYVTREQIIIRQKKEEIKNTLSDAIKDFAKKHRIDITEKYEGNKIGYEYTIRSIDTISSSEIEYFIQGKYPIKLYPKGIILRRKGATFMIQNITLKKDEKTRVSFITHNHDYHEESY